LHRASARQRAAQAFSLDRAAELQFVSVDRAARILVVVPVVRVDVIQHVLAVALTTTAVDVALSRAAEADLPGVLVGVIRDVRVLSWRRMPAGAPVSATRNVVERVGERLVSDVFVAVPRVPIAVQLLVAAT